MVSKILKNDISPLLNYSSYKYLLIVYQKVRFFGKKSLIFFFKFRKNFINYL